MSSAESLQRHALSVFVGSCNQLQSVPNTVSGSELSKTRDVHRSVSQACFEEWCKLANASGRSFTVVVVCGVRW